MSRTDEVGSAENIQSVIDRLTNVTVIDRPTSVRTLVSAVQAALRARRRQYQIRHQIDALRNADEALRLADRRKDEFLATLAHELRNPLAPLRSALQIMELRGVTDGQQQRLLTMMDRQLRVMVRLIDDLMDVARISSGKVVLQRQRIDMREVVREAVEACQPIIETAGHRLAVSLPEEPADVLGDPTRLAQVVGNLLNNAAKYTPDGGQLNLALSLEEDTVILKMHDDGVGLPPEVIRHVFDMFAQVNRTLDRAQGGLGIGLSLVKRLLEMHGGSIKASSDGVDTGSTFTVCLPRLPRSSEVVTTMSNDAAESASMARRRILVVDDNRDAADALVLLLEASGQDAMAAYDGAKALDLARQMKPRVVLCDIGMPGMNGHEVATRLRQDPAHATTTLVAVTGWGTEEDQRQAKVAGFDFHFTKPVDMQRLSQLLQGL